MTPKQNTTQDFSCWLSHKEPCALPWGGRSLEEAAVEEVGLYVGGRRVREGQIWTVRAQSRLGDLYTVKVQAKTQDTFEAISVAPYKPRKNLEF